MPGREVSVELDFVNFEGWGNPQDGHFLLQSEATESLNYTEITNLCTFSSCFSCYAVLKEEKKVSDSFRYEKIEFFFMQT